MVAGNAGEGWLERRQQALQMRVIVGVRRIRKVAGYHDEVGGWIEAVQCQDAPLERLCRIDAAICQFAGAFDVKVGNLGDANGSCRHSQSSSGRRRTDSGASNSPIRSPGFTRTAFGASTLSGLSETPLTVMRWRSPVKLTLSMTPDNCAAPASTIRMVSGRIMATATAGLTSERIACSPTEIG